MKRKMFILVALILFPGHSLFSQVTAGEFINEVNAIKARNSAGGLGYGDIQGSPYYTEEFVEGTVYLKNGTVTSLPLKYDLYLDEIEFLKEDRTYWVIKNEVECIELGEESIYPENSVYYFSRETGRYSLYIRKKVSFVPKVPPQGYAEEIPDRFDREVDEYYLKEENMPAREIRNKKGLLALLGDDESALDFVKKSKTKASSLEDLLELVQFLNARSQTHE
jgi:hypothetical protein